MSNMRLLKPKVNISTLEDGRGGIFTYLPEGESIREWSYIVTRKDSERGHHRHGEFDEYIMFVKGHGCYLEQIGEEVVVHLVGPGDCLYIPRNSIHTFKPMEDCQMVVLITKPWTECKLPLEKI